MDNIGFRKLFAVMRGAFCSIKVAFRGFSRKSWAYISLFLKNIPINQNKCVSLQ